MLRLLRHSLFFHYAFSLLLPLFFAKDASCLRAARAPLIRDVAYAGCHYAACCCHAIDVTLLYCCLLQRYYYVAIRCLMLRRYMLMPAICCCCHYLMLLPLRRHVDTLRHDY